MYINKKLFIIMYGIISSSASLFIFSNNTHFEIIIPTYNNEKYCMLNLRSAIDQHYPNFHITVINDCSTDLTGCLLDEFVKKYNLANKVTIIHNATRQGALFNLYRTIHQLDDDSVVISLDGDDMLAHNQVLTKLDDVYRNYNVWLTYGQFRSWPFGDVGWCTAMPSHIVQESKFREWPHIPSHLRTFRVWLFKKINVNDLMYEGSFFPMTWDQAMMFPMIEMAAERHAFIRDVLYWYNEETPLNDHKVNGTLQGKMARIIRSKAKYKRLVTIPKHLECPAKPLYPNETKEHTQFYAKKPRFSYRTLHRLKTLKGNYYRR